jgi:hypothetical protein
MRAPIVVVVAAAAALLGACGPDQTPDVDCADPARVTPPDRTVPYSVACCADAECADPPFDDAGAPSSGKAACYDYGDRGHLCTRTCASDSDCAGYGPEVCLSTGVCDAMAAEPPTPSDE